MLRYCLHTFWFVKIWETFNPGHTSLRQNCNRTPTLCHFNLPLWYLTIFQCLCKFTCFNPAISFTVPEILEKRRQGLIIWIIYVICTFISSFFQKKGKPILRILQSCCFLFKNSLIKAPSIIQTRSTREAVTDIVLHTYY